MSRIVKSNSGKSGRWLKIEIGIILIACLVTVGFSKVAVAADKGPITLAFMAELTAQRAQVGEDMVTGFKMYLEEKGYKIAGRQIKLLVEDHGEADVAVPKVRRFITSDKVAAIAGIFSTDVTYAIIPLVTEANVGLVLSGAAGNDATQRFWTKNVVRVNAAGCQAGYVAGDYAYNHLGWRRAAIVGWAHAFGQETIGAFQHVFEAAGGKVVQRIYFPRETLDFGPYISSLKGNADGLFEVVTAAPSLNFFKALRPTGLMDKWKVLSVLSATDESFLQELGNNGLGVMTANNYSWALDNPENIKFREKVQQKIKRDCTGPLMDSYTAALWIGKAIEAVNGDVENKDKFNEALQSQKMANSPHGALSIDHGQVVQDMYIRRIDKVNGHYQNTVIYTYPKVNQFWKFDPQTILKSKPYDENNPPCKYCE